MYLAVMPESPPLMMGYPDDKAMVQLWKGAVMVSTFPAPSMLRTEKLQLPAPRDWKVCRSTSASAF